MNKKLTLNINDSLIKFIHEYSKETHQSISSLVEKYFIILKKENLEKKHTKKTNELYGMLSESPLPDKKKMKAEMYEKNIN